MSRPVALDLCVGLGGWVEGLTAEGWQVIGIDIEDMFAALGEPKPDHFGLIIEDICNIRGADYAHVDLIVGSSPCQDFSYRAMPWSRAKALHAPFLGIWLFWQQFRIQRECNEARSAIGLPPVPMVVENVQGAQPWVGRARWNFGSYYLWGDVPALLPLARRGPMKYGVSAAPRMWRDRAVPRLNDAYEAVAEPVPASPEGIKQGGDWFSDGSISASRRFSSKSIGRKRASAKIAKIPFALSSHIARVYLPERAAG
jgi:hypothetical protein